MDIEYTWIITFCKIKTYLIYIDQILQTIFKLMSYFIFI